MVGAWVSEEAPDGVGWCVLRFSSTFLLLEEKGCSGNGQLYSPRFPHLPSHTNAGTVPKGFVWFQDWVTAWETPGWKWRVSREAGQAGRAELLLRGRQGPAPRSARSRERRSGSEEAVFLISVPAVRLRPSVLVCKKRLRCSSER